VGPVLFGRLLHFFGSVERVLTASMSELARVEGIGEKTAQRIFASRNEFDPDKEIGLATKHGVSILHLQDRRYPPLLKTIHDPPPVLYISGTIQDRDNLAVAIVGSRRCSHYGTEQASRFAHLLASAGFTIVSGMARGIDSAAHRGAIAAKGRTFAVQGCGLSRVFPPENEELFRLIGESGACISELPIEYEPLAENFPGRNRIIAGLSMGVIVIDASNRSGALLTAEAAVEYNREVMAVPGRVDSPSSVGAHRLIKDGARLVETVEDVMDALGYVGQGLKEHTRQSAQKAEKQAETPLFDRPKIPLSGSEKVVFEALGTEPLHSDQVIENTGLTAAQVNAAMVSLRLKGLIRDLPGNCFIKRS
jgi:DNA processing protein